MSTLIACSTIFVKICGLCKQFPFPHGILMDSVLVVSATQMVACVLKGHGYSRAVYDTKQAAP
jgi:hypothetical protein